MQHAPAVSYPSGRSGSLKRALWGLGLLGALPSVYLLFEALVLQGSARAAIVSVAICVVLWLVACLALAQFWRRQRARTLRWDGADWWLGAPGQGAAGGDEARGRATIRVDGQRCLLLRWTPAQGGEAAWLWADAAIDPVRWHLLRCALYSKPPRPGDDAGVLGTQRA